MSFPPVAAAEPLRRTCRRDGIIPVRECFAVPKYWATYGQHCQFPVYRRCYRVPMDPLYRRAIIQGILGTILFIALIFWPAGTFHYWQGWLFLAVFSASTSGFTIYLALYDKPLLERRLAAGPQHEKERSQKIIVSLIFVAFFALIVLPALDHRYGWSPVPPGVTI